ncbi:MAG: CHAT domain-containing protein [Deltaproteobacteria bacterium]|nr:CHAT domain-containing protein [Deltaproteobacteria bacterium]
MILRSLAKVARWERNYEKARAAFRALELQCEKWGTPTLCQADALTRLGDVNSDAGDLPEARANYQRSLEIGTLFAPKAWFTVRPLRGLAMVSIFQGELLRAEEFLLEARNIIEEMAPESIAEARLLYSLGSVALSRGELNKAQSRNEKAVRILEKKSPFSHWKALALLVLSRVAQDRGHLEAAAELVSRASVVWAERSRPGFTAMAVESHRGTVLADMGDWEGGRRALEKALNIARQLFPGSPREAAGFGRLSRLALNQGDTASARDYLLRALEVQERTVPDSLDMASTFNLLGMLDVEQGKISSGKAFHTKALELRQHLAPNSLKEAESLEQLGKISLEQGNFLEAESLQRKAHGLYQLLAPYTELAAASFHQLGRISRQRGEPEAAAGHFLIAIDILDRVGRRIGHSRSSRLEFRSRNSRYFKEAISLLVDQGREREAFHVLERSRSRTFLELLAEREFDFSDQLPPEIEESRSKLAMEFDRAMERLRDPSLNEDKESFDSTREKLKELRRRAQEIEVEIRRTNPGIADLQYPTPLDFTATQGTLDPGTALLAFSLGKTESHVFFIDAKKGLRVQSLEVGEEEVRLRVEEFRKAVSTARTVEGFGFKRFRWASSVLFETLLGPVHEWLSEAERLLILPDGALYTLPFAALVREFSEPQGGTSEWQYLVEWKPLHQISSATVFSQLKKMRERVSLGKEENGWPFIAAFGDPSFGSETGNEAEGREISDFRVRNANHRGFFDWSPLPHTRHEVIRIGEIFPNVQTFLGEDATEERVKSLGPLPHIIHFATHAFVDDTMPMASALVFSLPEGFPKDRENGLLQMWEIFEQVRLDADLVVLSACETGLGEIRGGEGLIGLTRAFQYAGARSVLASLWRVEDQATAELMIRFYSHLRLGRSKDDALRAAQMDFLQGLIKVEDEEGAVIERDYSAPYYWAAFQLYGDWM